MKKTFLLALFSGLVLTACSVPPAAYQTRGNPETLLDSSSERVSFGLGLPSTTDDVTAWINKDRPARAEIGCGMNGESCTRTEEVLNQFGIPYKPVVPKDGNSSVALIYDRITARDCDNRYIDNSDNSLNLNHPTFGCSIAVNSVQMVTDRQEFLNPALRDFPDAERSSMGYHSYLRNN